MKTLKRKMFAFIMVCALTLGMSTVAFAAEVPTTPANGTLTLTAEDGTVYSVDSTNGIYLDVFDDARGTVGTSQYIPAGTYQLAYSVTTPGMLGFFADGYDGYTYNISGSGEMTVKFYADLTQWYFLPDNLSTNYSYSFIVYN